MRRRGILPWHVLLGFVQMKIIDWGLKSRAVLLNLLFGAYLLFLHPILLRRLAATQGYSTPDPLIGTMLLLLPLTELAGVYLKRPLFAYRFAKRFPDDRSIFQHPRLQTVTIVFSFFSLLFGMALSAIFTFAALNTLGITSPAMLCLPIFPVVILRGSFIGMIWYGAGLGGVAVKAPRRISKGLRWRDLLGDVLLLCYGAVGYTALWEANPFFRSSAWGHFFFEDLFPGTTWGDDLFALLYLVAVYIVLRSVYLVQDIFLETRPAAKLWSWLTFVAALVIAMISID